MKVVQQEDDDFQRATSSIDSLHKLDQSEIRMDECHTTGKLDYHAVNIEEPLGFVGGIPKAKSSKYIKRSMSETSKWTPSTFDQAVLLNIGETKTMDKKDFDDIFKYRRKRGMSEPAKRGKLLGLDECSKTAENENGTTLPKNDPSNLLGTASKKKAGTEFSRTRSAPLLGLIHEPSTSSFNFRLRQWIQPMDNKMNIKVFGSRRAMEDEQLRLRRAGFVIHPTSPFR